MLERSPASGLALVFAALAATTCAAQSPRPSAAPPSRAAFDALLAEHWEMTLQTAPEFASILGDKRYNDRLTDFSQAAIERDNERARKFLQRFEAVDSATLPADARLDLELMVRDLRLSVAAQRFKNWQMPVLHNSGIHIDFPQLVAMLSFATVKDYEDYLSRLRALPRLFDETLAQMRKGMQDGLMPPAILLPKIVRQCDEIAGGKPEQSPYAEPLGKFPAAVAEPDRQRLRTAILAAIKEGVVPAYRKLAAFVRDEYAPRGRKDVGVWALPDGPARYAHLVKTSTTTELTPDAIHDIGLREVARIETEMLAIARKLGFADLPKFNAAIAANPALHPRSREEILALYRRYTERMYTKLPTLFGRLPKAGLEVKPVETFREKEAAAAAYNQGTPDGSRPGFVMINTGDYAKRLTIGIETTALHEGVPGHHMQIAIAQELPELPPFRQQTMLTAFVEGWALYSERLGGEVGFYEDPYSRYGHLQGEMLRAIRLVVDTGLHHKRWTRQQVVDYFHAHSGIEEVEVQSETDRYIAWPAQALGYKIGQLEILELRARARSKLGERFDIRAFHDEVLGAGALPLDVLRRRIEAWMTRVAAGGPVAAR